LVERGAYRPYFPHRIGHSLGLDVHDSEKLRADSDVLRAGMVFTVEPGLYFSKRSGRIPACGIRIEDDVRVTKSGCEVLSKAIPKDPDEIEALLAG